MVKEMHLQENTFFDLDPKVNVTQNVAQCPLQHVIYAVTMSKGLGGDAFTKNTFFDLRIKVTQNIAKYQGSKHCGFRQKDFFHVGPYISLCNLCDPREGPFLAPWL